MVRDEGGDARHRELGGQGLPDLVAVPAKGWGAGARKWGGRPVPSADSMGAVVRTKGWEGKSPVTQCAAWWADRSAGWASWAFLGREGRAPYPGEGPEARPDR